MNKIVARFTWLAICAVALTDVRPAAATITLQSPNPAIHDRFQNQSGFIGNPYDWSGVGRGSSSGWATAVAPSFVLSAKHYTPGGTIRFYHTNDASGLAYEDRTILSSSSLANGDMWVGQLNAPLSSNVAIYPILDLPSFSSYDNLEIFTFGLNVAQGSQTRTSVRLGRNEIDPGSAGIYDMDPGPGVSPAAYFLFDYDNPGGVGADESRLEGGDSGGPSFHIINGIPALVGIHWFQTSTPIGSGDSFVPAYVQSIQTFMDTKPGDETLTLIPEPSTMFLATLAGAGGLLASRCRRGNRRRIEKIG